MSTEKISEVAEQVGMTSAGVTLSISATINKIVKRLLETTSYDVFDICLGLSDYLGEEPKDIVRKLNKKHKEMLLIAAQLHLGKTKKNEEENVDFEAIFR